MLKDTMKTRRSLILDGYLVEMGSPEGDMPTAVTRGLVERAETILGRYNEHMLLSQIIQSWRMHAAVNRRPRVVGHEEFFTLFLDDGDVMHPIQVKAIFGRGDYGESVLTFGDTGESVEFTGTVTRIRADYILYLANFMAREGEPGCRIEVTPHPSGGAILCATSGPCMGIIHAQGSYCEEPFSLEPSKKFLTECKAKYGEGARWVILDGERATVEASNGRVMHIEPGKAVSQRSEYDWAPLVKSALEKAGASPILNAPLNVAELGRFFANTPGGQSAIRLYCAGGEDVVVVKLSGVPEFLGLMAPVRVNGFGPIWPGWLTHLNAEFKLDDFMDQWTEAQAGPEAVTQ